ncbi:MAG: hypothetical protein B7Z15_07360 [Rhizobiales bacterium 32-66-8]|nr:MAG: hypothetical protein B7Z15_07360 [Rhizobiales bacterium 32-66-8]
MQTERHQHGYDLHGLRRISDYTGLSIWKVRDLVADRKIPVARIGGVFFARSRSLLQWMEKHEAENNANVAR